ncbi:MAG: hypothetical protein WCI27_03905 [Candidatus Omnitrophota bacterium]
MKINLNYRWDKNAFLKANYYNLKYGEVALIKKIGGPISIVLCLATMFFIYIRGFKSQDVIPFILVTYFYALRWPIYKLQVSRNFKKYSERDREISWEIGDEVLKGSVKGTSEGQFSWDLIKKVVKTKEGYLLHRYPMFHWFPISAFNNDLDIKNFEDLARVKVKDFVNVK